VTTPVEAPHLHTCRCGNVFSLSARNTREHRRRGTVPICRNCRLSAKPPDPEEAERLRRWWLEESGFTLDHLVEISEMIGWEP